MILIVIILVLVVIASIFISTYNKLVRMRNLVEKCYSGTLS